MSLRISLLKKKFHPKYIKMVTNCKACKKMFFKADMFRCYDCMEPLFCKLCVSKIDSYKCRKKK